MTVTWPGHLHKKIVPRTATGQMQSEISCVHFCLVSLVRCAANTRPGFGTETRKSADVTEIRRPLQQQQNLSLSQPVLLPCNPPSLSHARTPNASTCKTLLQRYHEERAVTPDFTQDSKERELALSPAFPVCIGSEKNRNYFNKPSICKNSHFPRGLLTKK